MRTRRREVGSLKKPASTSGWRGVTMRDLNWTARDLEKMRGSRSMAPRMASRTLGRFMVIWYAMVAISGLAVLRDESFLEKKKLASIIISSSHISAMVCAIADFPAPAGPYTHIMNASRSSSHLIHFIIFSRTAIRVFGWHLGGSKRSYELWNALVAVAR